MYKKCLIITFLAFCPTSVVSASLERQVILKFIKIAVAVRELNTKILQYDWFISSTQTFSIMLSNCTGISSGNKHSKDLLLMTKTETKLGEINGNYFKSNLLSSVTSN